MAFYAMSCSKYFLCECINLYNSLGDRYYYCSNFVGEEREVGFTNLPRNTCQGQGTDLRN